MLLAQLAVVFVGIAGDRGGSVHKQIAPILAHSHMKATAIPADQLKTLTHHGEDSRAIVRGLHADGVVGAELLQSDGKWAFRVVIYDRDGSLKSLGETPLDGRALSIDDLEALRSNLDTELASFPKQGSSNKAAKVPASEVADIEMTEPKRTATPMPTKALPIAKKTKTVARATPVASSNDDDETPPGLDGKAAKAKPAKVNAIVAKATPVSDNEAETHHDAAPVEVADRISMDDIEAQTGGGVATSAPEGESSNTALAQLHLHAGVGIGVVGRNFAGPAAVDSYGTTPVGAVRFEAGAQPTARVGVNVLAERTLSMTTPLADGMAPTSMARFEATASYALVHGKSFQLAPRLGVGSRSFQIDSTDPSRSPDSTYHYAVVGASANAALGSRVTLRANLDFEPVFGGAQPIEMAFGSATRWAVDVGGALDWRPIDHLFARVAVDFQRFSWSWSAAGARASGGAVDAYPSGMVSVGAEY